MLFYASFSLRLEKKMDIYERLQYLCKMKGTTIKQMEIDNGMTKGHAFKWKKSTPTYEYLLKLSEYFGVSTDYILTGEQSGVSKESHYDVETEMLARELQKNKELRAIFDVAKGMPKERLDAFYNLLKDLK
uniref:Repressor protein n=1 Tax=Podoviridae sp. ctoqT5 TaxID=2826577 RepID=A0A8S5MNZ6_9CAUD|nr:MAG TPA: repressor protein [Podoviridae sp. ctoqT5]